MIKKSIFALVTFIATLTSWAFEDVDFTTSNEGTPGTWNTNFQTSLDYAKENNIPVVLYYGVYGCSFAERGVKALKMTDIVSWFNQKKIIMIYKRSSIGRAYDVAMARTAAESPDSDQWKADRWVINGTDIRSYPIMRFYWNKADGTEVTTTFSMRNKQMPVKEPSGDKLEKLSAQMLGSLKQYFDSYTPAPTPDPEDESEPKKLTPSESIDEFFSKVNDSKTTVNACEWSSNGKLCLKKAKTTGYPMIWVVANKDSATKYPNGATARLIRNSFCKQSFCDMINSHGSVILCYEFFESDGVAERYNTVHGYANPTEILNEETGLYETNHRGYPVLGSDGKYTVLWPSVTMLKIDSSTDNIFHVCADRGSTNLLYDTSLSPYSKKYPVNGVMLDDSKTDWFSKWLANYLVMFGLKWQIAASEEDNATQTTISNVVVAVTETISPTLYQIALHRDNLLFRSITVLNDISVMRRIGDDDGMFDDRISIRNVNGKLFLNHDHTVSAIEGTDDSNISFDIVASSNCTFVISQRSGNGFSVDGYYMKESKDVATEQYVSEIGTTVVKEVTNSVISIADKPFTSTNVLRNFRYEESMTTGRLYRITTEGNSTFDVFYTK